jgi:hypothetical protein
MCLVKIQTAGIDHSFVEVGKTETITNNLNPKFGKPINAKYYFEKDQKLRFEVRDDDGKGSFDEIGHVETTMGNIMGSRAQTWIGELKSSGSSNRGKIIVQAESLQTSNVEIHMQIQGQDLKNKTSGCGGMCEEIHDVCFEIQRPSQNDPNQYNSVYQSEVATGTASPVFSPFKKSLSALANADEDCQLKIAIKSRGVIVGTGLFSITGLTDIKSVNITHNGGPLVLLISVNLPELKDLVSFKFCAQDGKCRWLSVLITRLRMETLQLQTLSMH